jgi:peptidoglycan/LPS O-acetylase OafA/YrhL
VWRERSSQADGGDPLTRSPTDPCLAQSVPAADVPEVDVPPTTGAASADTKRPTIKHRTTRAPRWFGAVPSHESFLSQRRFASLNGLRCVAILEVIWHHASGRRLDPAGRGVGVDLSFAISGFLITTLLVREYSRTGKINVRRFYARRTLRIFPLYFAVLGLYVALVLGTRGGMPEETAFLHHLPAFATYTSNWFVPLGDGQSTIFYFAWSLATQEQFYLLWPLALLLCLAPGRWWRAGAVMVAVLAVDQIGLHAMAGRDFGLTVVRSIGTPICLGALWALVLHSRTGFAAARRVLGHRLAAPLLLAALGATFLALAPFEVVEVLLSAIVAACCIREDNLAAPFLTASPLVFVGQVSYGMYLLHMLAVNAVRPIIGERYGIPVFLAGAALTIALASATYRWFETPILRYRERLPTGKAHVAVAGRAPVRTPARSWV